MTARLEGTRYLVVGAAGYAQEVAWSLREVGAARGQPCEFLFFDDQVRPGLLPSGLGEVAGGIDRLRDEPWPGAQLVMGLGLPRSKEAVAMRLAGVPLLWATVIHPQATIGPNVAIGEGSYVAAGAVVTVNARIGRFATINIHCQVAHDDVLGDFVTLHPDVHLSGCVTVGDRCELGTGAVVIPGLTVGEGAVVGAGGVVVRSLPGHQTYVGLPAREQARAPETVPARTGGAGGRSATG